MPRVLWNTFFLKAVLCTTDCCALQSRGLSLMQGLTLKITFESVHFAFFMWDKTGKL